MAVFGFDDTVTLQEGAGVKWLELGMRHSF